MSIPGLSMLLGALYLWLSCCHCQFTLRLRESLTGESRPTLSWLEILRSQALIQSVGLLLMTGVALSIAALPWALAYSQTTAAFPYTTKAVTPRAIMRYASRAASMWSTGNINLLLCLALFSLFVFLNIFMLLIFLPELVKILTGEESVFTMNMLAMVSGTVFASAAILTWACIDPLL